MTVVFSVRSVALARAGSGQPAALMTSPALSCRPLVAEPFSTEIESASPAGTFVGSVMAAAVGVAEELGVADADPAEPGRSILKLGSMRERPNSPAATSTPVARAAHAKRIQPRPRRGGGSVGADTGEIGGEFVELIGREAGH